jgi:hypothetical protein
MSWVLPAVLLPVAGLLALVLTVPRLASSAPAARWFREVFALTMASIGLVWLGWIVLWWVEQRW